MWARMFHLPFPAGQHMPRHLREANARIALARSYLSDGGLLRLRYDAETQELGNRLLPGATGFSELSNLEQLQVVVTPIAAIRDGNPAAETSPPKLVFQRGNLIRSRVRVAAEPAMPTVLGQ